MAWGTLAESAFLTVDASFEFFTDGADAIVLALNPRETASLVFNVDAAGTSDDLEIEVLQGHRTSDGNGLAGATSTSDIELNAADGFTTDDDMNGTYIVMTSGAARGEGRLIVDSVAADNGVVLSHAFSAAPAAADTYALYRLTPFRFSIDPQTTIHSDNQNNDGLTADARNGQYIAVAARATGATDGHRVQMSYQVDGVSV